MALNGVVNTREEQRTLLDQKYLRIRKQNRKIFYKHSNQSVDITSLASYTPAHAILSWSYPV